MADAVLTRVGDFCPTELRVDTSSARKPQRPIPLEEEGGKEDEEWEGG